MDTSVSVVFHMEAFPSPTVFNFTYLGHTPTVNSSGPVPDGVIFNVTCSKTHAEYAMKCNVSVEDVKNESAAGFYAFIASNSFGSEKFVFLVKVDSMYFDFFFHLKKKYFIHLFIYLFIHLFAGVGVFVSFGISSVFVYLLQIFVIVCCMIWVGRWLVGYATYGTNVVHKSLLCLGLCVKQSLNN